MLLCLVCLTLLASFFLPSHLSLKTCTIRHQRTAKQDIVNTRTEPKYIIIIIHNLYKHASVSHDLVLVCK